MTADKYFEKGCTKEDTDRGHEFGHTPSTKTSYRTFVNDAVIYTLNSSTFVILCYII